MEDQNAGDPHTLAQQWSGGSMWWHGWEDINKMRNLCKKTSPPKSEFIFQNRISENSRQPRQGAGIASLSQLQSKLVCKL